MLNGPHSAEFQLTSSWEDSCDGIAVLDPLLGPHEVEQQVWRELQQASGGQFLSLIVRRMEGGVCLQGVLETGNDDFLCDVDSLVKRVACVEHVLNQLVMRKSQSAS